MGTGTNRPTPALVAEPVPIIFLEVCSTRVAPKERNVHFSRGLQSAAFTLDHFEYSLEQTAALTDKNRH